jgi:hypothetical protein
MQNKRALVAVATSEEDFEEDESKRCIKDHDEFSGMAVGCVESSESESNAPATNQFTPMLQDQNNLRVGGT